MNLRTLPVLLGAVMLAGCAGASPHTTTAAATVGASAAPPSCHAQYETWKHGTAVHALAEIKPALARVQSAGAAGDLLRLRGALEKTGRAAGRLAKTPPPRCADPRGYYALMLTDLRAAGDNAKAASGLAGIVLAEAPLKKVPAVEKKLNAELDQTVGKNR